MIERVEAAYRHSAWRLEDTHVTDEPGLFRTRTPSSSLGLHNVIRGCAGPIPEDFRGHWTVMPRDPAELEPALIAAGWRLHADMVGMWRDPGPVDAPQVPIRTLEPLEYALASGAAWGNSPDWSRRFAGDVRRAQARGMQLYGVVLAGRIAATAKLLPAPGSAYLMGGAVHPDFRGRGLYRALVAHRLERAESDVVTLVALADTSAPICRRLGFHEVGPFRLFVPVSEKA